MEKRKRLSLDETTVSWRYTGVHCSLGCDVILTSVWQCRSRCGKRAVPRESQAEQRTEKWYILILLRLTIQVNSIYRKIIILSRPLQNISLIVSRKHFKTWNEKCRYNWHSAGSLGWPFPMRKFYQTVPGNCYGLKLPKCWLQFLKVNLLCHLLQFSAHFRSQHTFYQAAASPPATTSDSIYCSGNKGQYDTTTYYLDHHYSGKQSQFNMKWVTSKNQLRLTHSNRYFQHIWRFDLKRIKSWFKRIRLDLDGILDF